MARNTSFEMGLPPFRGAVREIILGSTAIYIVLLLLQAFDKPLGDTILILGTLVPDAILHGWVWQFVTYAFMYVDPMDFVLSLVGIYFLGYSVEERIRRPRFYALFFGSVVFSALIGFALSFAPVIAKGPAYGSGAAANAILIQIPVKWIVIGIGAIETAYLLLYRFALFYCISLLGLAVGYLWYKLFLTGRTSFGFAERFYGVKNSYYRWKRRRAARKFEVYMRKHDQVVHFDEHGNYIPPDDDKKNGGGKSGWVN
jgi:membrane associated rhomboid family serine protease